MVLSFSLGTALTLVTVGVGAAISVQRAAKRWSGFRRALARRAPIFEHSGGGRRVYEFIWLYRDHAVNM